MREGAVSVPERRKRSKDKIVNHGKNDAESSTDGRIKKRLAQAALTFHCGESGDRPAQNHL